MALFLQQLACSIVCRIRLQVLKSAGLVGLAVVTLSSCSRAAYVFSPSAPSYLATERAAPSVPASFQEATILADSLPAAMGERSHVLARAPVKKPRLLAAKHSGHLPTQSRL
jgi:hypothetical protein